jgi:hypothetical protein
MWLDVSGLWPLLELEHLRLRISARPRTVSAQISKIPYFAGPRLPIAE